VDADTARVIVFVVSGGLGFAFVLGLTREIVGDDTASKLVVIGVFGVVGLILTAILGVVVKGVPIDPRSVHGVDDVAGWVAAMPWAAIDKRIGDDFTGKSLFFGMASGAVYEGYRWYMNRDKSSG
jgi:hypothetical protein